MCKERILRFLKSNIADIMRAVALASLIGNKHGAALNQDCVICFRNSNSCASLQKAVAH